ncbi:MAG: bifunctional 4-hydroxy-2-oxoglutarate aldolase/2-dehydro-3-deoxy-phosphogluconate aldolase [Verrucomicrobia bacterium]|nr:bifunctional 4-hydroxy-2-oxoglutarate aldolase/2-dehydro-3-deoxy-phosphogluconate aldolase [Verrucomicrobiota bacterium]
MNPAFPSALLEKVRQSKIIAVVVIDDANDAAPLAGALLAGGISAIELTLRTPTAFESLRRIREAYPDMMTGLGTVLKTEQVDKAVAAGAAFAVAPGFNANIVRAAKSAGLAFAPGIVTPSDIEGAAELDCKLLKFFPAEPSGGVPYLSSMSAPYAHLDLEYIPLGGLDEGNFTRYLSLKNVPAVGGSWIAPRDLIQKKEWATITANARRAFEKI